jgi:hypothetical protein
MHPHGCHIGFQLPYYMLKLFKYSMTLSFGTPNSSKESFIILVKDQPILILKIGQNGLVNFITVAKIKNKRAYNGDFIVVMDFSNVICPACRKIVR